jgi:hypothetical protein
MVDNFYVYSRCGELAKDKTSGYQTIDEYNNDAKQVTGEMVELLMPFYETNQQVVDALEPLFKSNQSLTISGTGVITKPTDYLHLDSIGVKVGDEYKPARKVNRNQVDMIMSSSVRRFDVLRHQYGYYFENNNIQLLPKTQLEVEFRYIKKPADPYLSLIPATDSDDDYYVQDPDATKTKDFEFNSSMTNLIIYLMLEKRGIQMREAILTEFATMGINREMIKPQPTA